MSVLIPSHRAPDSGGRVRLPASPTWASTSRWTEAESCSEKRQPHSDTSGTETAGNWRCMITNGQPGPKCTLTPVGGRLRPTNRRLRLALVSPCEDESHDHVNSVHFCDLEDGIQGVPASAGLASSPGVGGSRSAEENDALHFSRHLARQPIIHEFMVSHLVFVLARCLALLPVFLLHRVRLVFVPGCRALPAAVVPCMSQDVSPVPDARKKNSVNLDVRTMVSPML